MDQYEVLDWVVQTTIQYYYTTSAVTKLKDALLIYTIHKYIFVPIATEVYGYGLLRSLIHVYHLLLKKVYSILFKLPFVKKKIDAEVNKTRQAIEDGLIKHATNVNHPVLPKHGLSKEQVLKQLESLNEIECVNWQNGKISGAVYHGGNELLDLQSMAYHKFSVANQLHPDAFPGVRQMESEVVSMVLDLFHAPSTGCGTTTSGGTESLLLACLAARERAKDLKGITEPEIVAPKTIHAAIFKAAQYFNMKLNLADIHPETFTVDINHVKRLVNKNTVIILGSAPNFPYGTIDDIPALSKIAVKKDIPLHVDCCLGSFVIAFYKDVMNKPLPFNFDFKLPGVTSISCDTHKYGFAPKGSSVIMYRSPKYRKYQYYISNNWVGGLYGSPTLAGSRPGALTVGAWATMVYLGRDGYKKQVGDILHTARVLRTAIENDFPELQLIGDPLLSVVAFQSGVVNVHALGDKLSKEFGWHLSSLQQPAALHLAVTRLTKPAINQLLTDLRVCLDECVEVVKKDGSKALQSDTAQLYGVAESVSTRGIVDKLIESFIDTLYATKKTSDL